MILVQLLLKSPRLVPLALALAMPGPAAVAVVILQSQCLLGCHWISIDRLQGGADAAGLHYCL